MKLEKMSWIAGIVVAIFTVLGVIVAVVSYLVDRNTTIEYCKSFYKTLSAPFVAVFNWFEHPVTWPTWAFFVFGVAIIVAIVIVVVCSFFLSTRSKPSSANHLDYRTDDILGIHWRWGYFNGQLDPDEISAFCPCPDCRLRLEPRINSNALFNTHSRHPPVSLVCSRCGFQRDFDMDLKQVHFEVLKEVERRINTGAFVNRIGQQR